MRLEQHRHHRRRGQHGTTRTGTAIETIRSSGAQHPARLIVNADDCGYLPAVTRGIGAGIAAGVITATGVLTNGPGFDDARALLGGSQRADCGVHLNLTWGAPLSARMAQACAAGAPSGAGFGGLAVTLRRIVAGRLPLALVEEEWRAQIERALHAGLEVRFLNTHQHIDLLPPLRALLVQLARAYRVAHLRRLRAEWRASRSAAALVRNAAVMVLSAAGRGAARADQGAAADGEPAEVPCAGIGSSGALDLAYLEQLLAGLAPGSCTELMCHPGHDDGDGGDAGGDGSARKLRRYHAWEQELAALCSPQFRALCERHRVTLVRFRDLDPGQGAQ